MSNSSCADAVIAYFRKRFGHARAPKLRKSRSSSLLVVVASFVLSGLTAHAAAGQNSHAGPVTGVIDAVRFDADQFYVFGWACQEGDRASIDVHFYANRSASDNPPGTFVTAAPTSAN